MKIIETKEGWSVIEGDLISNWVIQSGKLDHDSHLPPIACREIPVGGVVFDCGANLGTHAVAYARKLGKKGTLICIEAGKDAFACLANNAKKFECQTLCLNSALSDVHGTWLTHLTDEKNVGGSRIVDFQPKGDKIWTVTIDSLVKDGNINRCDFIKLDIEGFELKALKGAVETLSRFKPTLMIEMNSGRLKENGATYADIHTFLDRNAYQFSNPLQAECHAGSLQYDILAKPI